MKDVEILRKSETGAPKDFIFKHHSIQDDWGFKGFDIKKAKNPYGKHSRAIQKYIRDRITNKIHFELYGHSSLMTWGNPTVKINKKPNFGSWRYDRNVKRFNHLPSADVFQPNWLNQRRGSQLRYQYM